MILSGDEFGFATDEASDLSEFFFFLDTEAMRVFVIAIELVMKTTEVVIWIGGNQMKTPVEFIRYGAGWG